MKNLLLLFLLNFVILFVSCRPMNASVYTENHDNCLVTDWTKHSSAIKMTNALGKFGGNALGGIKRALDPVSLPVPIKLQLSQKFFGVQHEISISISSLRLHGLNEVTLIPLSAVAPTVIETGVAIDKMYLEFLLDVKFGKKTRRRMGVEFCPALNTAGLLPGRLGKCPVNTAQLKLFIEVKDAELKLLTDLHVYDCNRLTSSFISKVACKFKSSWDYVVSMFQNGFNGISERFFSRFHDAHVRQSSVGFRKFDMDLTIATEFSLILDPEMFGFIRTTMDSEFRDGVFHDSICSTLANTVRNLANDAIDAVRPMFNTKHLTSNDH